MWWCTYALSLAPGSPRMLSWSKSEFRSPSAVSISALSDVPVCCRDWSARGDDGFPLRSLRSGWDWPCRSSSRYAHVQGRIPTSSTSLLCASWHVMAAEAAMLMFCARPVWNSGSLSDPLNLTVPSILELPSFTLPIFRAKHLNTVYRYKVGAQRMSLNSQGFVLCKNAK